MSHVGLLKERKKDENRVALTPVQVAALTQRGHVVYVEPGAGINSGFSDDQYQKAGALLTPKEEILRSCQIIVKVKAPIENEYDDYGPNHTLFCYLHFDENIEREKILRLIRSGFLGIAYEWVEENGRYPLLEPMSRLTGYLFSMKACELLARYKGILPGRHESFIPGAKVLIIGIGTIGLGVLKYFSDIHADITVVDKNPSTLKERIVARFGTDAARTIPIEKMRIIPFHNSNPSHITKELLPLMPELDIILNCAVRRPDLPPEKLKHLITAEMISRMRPESVVCDTTACVRDFIETAVPHEEIHYFYRDLGVIHYNCDHIPSMVGNTATTLLSQATFPYVMELAEKGPLAAIRDNCALRRGVSCYKGFVTLKIAAEKKSLPYKDILDLL